MPCQVALSSSTALARHTISSTPIFSFSDDREGNPLAIPWLRSSGLLDRLVWTILSIMGLVYSDTHIPTLMQPERSSSTAVAMAYGYIFFLWRFHARRPSNVFSSIISLCYRTSSRKNSSFWGKYQCRTKRYTRRA